MEAEYTDSIGNIATLDNDIFLEVSNNMAVCGIQFKTTSEAMQFFIDCMKVCIEADKEKRSGVKAKNTADCTFLLKGGAE